MGRAEPALEAGAASLPFPTVEASHVRGTQSPSLGGSSEVFTASLCRDSGHPWPGPLETGPG